MKKDIHPQTHPVVFVDSSCKKEFIGRSTLTSEETREIDGVMHYVLPVEISSGSHPFYTGKQILVDTARRVEKFMARSAKKDESAAKKKKEKAQKRKKSTQEDEQTVEKKSSPKTKEEAPKAQPPVEKDQPKKEEAAQKDTQNKEVKKEAKEEANS